MNEAPSDLTLTINALRKWRKRKAELADDIAQAAAGVESDLHILASVEGKSGFDELRAGIVENIRAFEQMLLERRDS